MKEKELKELIEYWKSEENIAYIRGWDFSHIEDRYSEDTDFPWDYRKTVLKYLKPEMKLMDMDTGGGEFLLSLGHPHSNTSATEGYEPNVKLCAEVLLPLGVDFRPAKADGILPFKNDSFDMVINRHGSFNPQEIYRVLKKGGLFITQQVGGENERELVHLLCGDSQPAFPQQRLDIVAEQFRNAGFEIAESCEDFRPIRFYDAGALVWFARIIQWEFPDFSVDNNLENIFIAHNLIKEKGFVEGKTHRFMLVAKK